MSNNANKESITSIAIDGALFLVLISIIQYLLAQAAPQVQLSFSIQGIIASLTAAYNTGNYWGIIIIVGAVLIIGAAVKYTPEIEKELKI